MSKFSDGGAKFNKTIQDKIRRKKACEERMAEIREEYVKVRPAAWERTR